LFSEIECQFLQRLDSLTGDDFTVANGDVSPSVLALPLMSTLRVAAFRSLCHVTVAVVWLSVGGALKVEAASTVRSQLADGFDFPVGKPDGDNYYKFRGFTPYGHLGEDWNGRGGGDSDLGDPIYSIGRGVVVLSEDVRVGWGNVVIVRHAFRDESGRISMVDSLYGHLHERKVKVNQVVERGQLVGTMGGNNGMYAVHLHLEIRKNLQIGMNRSSFGRDYSNYYSPTQFINAHRALPAGFARVDIPVKTFAAYGQSLADADSSPVARTPRGFSIPVYRGSKTGPIAVAPRDKDKPKDPVARINEEARARAQAEVNTPSPSGDFWSRLKSKLSGGQVVAPEKK